MCFKGNPVRLLVIPGLNDSGPAHWQSWLQSHFSRRAVRVEQENWVNADLARWSRRIGMTMARHPRARWVAVAHSFGSLALLHHLAQGGEGVYSALLVAPADPAKFGVADQLPQARLAIPSTLIASETDPWMTFESASGWARAWGSQLINLGDAGHINTEAGFGPLPQAKALVALMVQRLERERRIDRAHPMELSFAI
ncbi:MAG: alpha/beta hydrolase [Rhizobiales bacterium]|nr:alpha/beta hydrolase [Rhizobacter sp.]